MALVRLRKDCIGGVKVEQTCPKSIMLKKNTALDKGDQTFRSEKAFQLGFGGEKSGKKLVYVDQTTKSKLLSINSS